MTKRVVLLMETIFQLDCDKPNDEQFRRQQNIKLK